jgi:hypothetical protein
MTRSSTTAIAIAIWGIGLIPATLVMQWLGLVAWSWRGFLTAYIVVAAITVSYELFQRWVERRLAARGAGSGAASEH